MSKIEINNIKRGKIANCVALHDFAKQDYDLKGLIEYLEHLFLSYDVYPTKITNITGGKKSLNYKNGKKKLEKCNYEGVDGFWIGATAADDYDDNFGSIFEADLDIREHKRHSFVICLDDNIVGFEHKRFSKLIREISVFFAPRYGYVYQRPFNKGPGFYPYAIISGVERGDPEEEGIAQWSKIYFRSNSKWKVGDLRDVYPGNILSKEHIDREVFGIRFENWIIQSQNRGNLEKLSDDLWIWWIDKENIDTIREELKPTGMILCI